MTKRTTSWSCGCNSKQKAMTTWSITSSRSKRRSVTKRSPSKAGSRSAHSPSRSARSPKRSSRKSSPRRSARSPLPESKMKYCRCLAHVAGKQTIPCLLSKKFGKKGSKSKCYNPYAVCSKSVKRKGRIECTRNLNFRGMPVQEVRHYAALKGVDPRRRSLGEVIAKLEISASKRSPRKSSKRRSPRRMKQ